MAYCDYRKISLLLSAGTRLRRITCNSTDCVWFWQIVIVWKNVSSGIREKWDLKSPEHKENWQVRISGKTEERRERTRIDFMVELRGIEPRTSCMPCKRSPSWAITPNAANDTWYGERCQIFFEFARLGKTHFAEPESGKPKNTKTIST